MKSIARILGAVFGATALSLTASAWADGASASTFDELIDRELTTKGGLTADEAARRTLAVSPSVQARKQDLLAAAADVDRATYAYLPTTTLSARYTRLSDSAGDSIGNIVAAQNPGPVAPGAPLFAVPLQFEVPLNQYAFEASIQIPVSDYLLRIGPNRQAAEFNREAAAENLESARRKAATDARLNYYAWIRARLNVIVAEQALLQARAHLEDARTALAAGSASESDVLRVESQVARSEQLVVSTKNLSALYEEQLRTSLHDEPSVRYRIGEDIRQPFIDRMPAALPELWNEAYANRSELKALAATEAARERSATVERAGYLPRLDAYADAAYSRPNSRIFPTTDEFRGSWDAGAKLTWTLSDLPAAGARVSAASARARSTAAERNDSMERIRIEVMQARQSVDEARVAENTYARGLVAAEESYRTRRLLFQNGRATSAELLDAETDLTRARIDALGSRIDARVAEVRLAYALGRSPEGGARPAVGAAR